MWPKHHLELDIKNGLLKMQIKSFFIYRRTPGNSWTFSFAFPFHQYCKQNSG